MPLRAISLREVAHAFTGVDVTPVKPRRPSRDDRDLVAAARPASGVAVRFAAGAVLPGEQQRRIDIADLEHQRQHERHRTDHPDGLRLVADPRRDCSCCCRSPATSVVRYIAISTAPVRERVADIATRDGELGPSGLAHFPMVEILASL